MAESAIECPATPERIDQCPDTPDRVLNLKSPDSSTSSDTECPINLRTRSSDSPPPNCAICLCRCKNKCFTDSCLHQFCFKCLLEWSKVKAECPLCKQPFNSIIHNVKSIDQFEEYLVAQPDQSPNISSVPLPMPPLAHQFSQPHPSHLIDLISSHHHSRSASGSAVAVAAHSLFPHRFDVFLGDYPRFRSELSNGSLVERLRQQYPNEIISPGSYGQLWRRYIYDRRLYAMPVVDITGRFRDCSARFLRDNPAQMHRLMAWLNRDVLCLRDSMVSLRDSEHQISYILNVISELLTIFNITSPEFRRRIQPYFRHRTAHFIHEFINFARSPYDMIGYDREVRYSPYYEEVIISSSSSSSGFSDSEDVVHIRPSRRGRTEFTIETRSNSSTIILTGTIEGQTEQDLQSTSRPPGIIEVNSTGVRNVNQVQVLGESQIIQIDRDIVLSSSSSDECEFVSAKKPPHLRTPELISLHSESDSDVVFVSEIKKDRSAESSAGRSRGRKRRVPKGVFISSLSASSSSSSTESEADEKKKTAEPIKGIAAEKVKREAESSNHTSTSNNNIDEYNNGASTSSALQNSENSLGKSNETREVVGCKKYYARPVRQSTSKRLKNTKTIYESSSSDVEDDDAIKSDKSTSDESYKCEKSSSSSVSSKALSKICHRLRKRKYERRRRSQKGISSTKKKKAKKSSKKKSKKRKTSCSSSKVRSKRSRKTYPSASSSFSSSSDLSSSSNGWSSSFSD